MDVRLGVVTLACALSAAPLLAQASGAGGAARVGPRLSLPREREIALARSAAPAAVADSATIRVFGADGRYQVAVRGTNGVACHVSRSWPRSLEPHCFDAEGAATIMRIEERRNELLHAGTPLDDVERAVAEDIAAGRLRLPRRPAMSWMMSSAQQLISDDGREVGAWRPHIMIYYPWLDAAELGLGGAPDFRHAVLVDGGRALSNIVIVVREFVEPAAAPAR